MTSVVQSSRIHIAYLIYSLNCIYVFMWLDRVKFAAVHKQNYLSEYYNDLIK